MKIAKFIIIAIGIITFSAFAYYIKSDVLRIDIFEHRHMLFWKE